jgi:hypothetical protein
MPPVFLQYPSYIQGKDSVQNSGSHQPNTHQKNHLQVKTHKIEQIESNVRPSRENTYFDERFNRKI